MSIHPSCIRRPVHPVDRGYRPPEGTPYKVTDADSWESLARQCGMGAWDLILYNYPTLPTDPRAAAPEVNWYLQEYVGCKATTADRTNYRFSAAAQPGMIYLPPTGPPIPFLNTIKDRRDAIMSNSPGIMVVKDNPAAKSYSKPWYSSEGAEEVTKNAVAIERAADRYGLDRDFVKAIAWIESTHGWYDRVDPWNKTIRPMNVHAGLWGSLGVSRSTLESAETNIEVGTYILSEIWARTSDPTPEKVATLYNALGATEVSGYGKTVDSYMRSRPWLRTP